MNKKIIKRKPKNGTKIHTRHISLSAFLDNKLVDFLTLDYKKIDTGDSEFCGKLNRYFVELLRGDLKKRNIL